MSDIAIKIENLGKRYRYGAAQSVSSNLRADLTDWVRGVFRRGDRSLKTEDRRLPASGSSPQSAAPSSVSSLKSKAESDETPLSSAANGTMVASRVFDAVLSVPPDQRTKEIAILCTDSRNNDPRNGLALSKNAHWQFDRGLRSITDDYRVTVNRNKFVEEGVPGQKLSDFDGHRLFLPGDPKYWPETPHLAWHREHKYSHHQTERV